MSRAQDRAVSVAAWRGGAWSTRADSVAVEEPLEIRVAGDPMAVTMRTPGADEDLVLGFLFAEGLIRSVADVGTLRPCGRPSEDGFGNVLDVLPGPGVAIDLERHALRRGAMTTSACGVCGRRTIDDLLARVPVRREAPAASSVPFIEAAVRALDAHQTVFPRTGGLHAALAVGADGGVLAAAEDVGRHNAVDKVVGRLVRRAGAAGAADGDPLGLGGAALLVVSGRVGFEIVQKAAAARIPAVAGVSAPSSLAVDLAERAGLVLVGFAREGRMNVYAHAEGLQEGDPNG